MKVCDVCRATNEPEAEFCGTCGSRLPVAQAAAEAATAVVPEPGSAETQVVEIAAEDDAVVPGSTPKSKAKAKAATGAAGTGADVLPKPKGAPGDAKPDAGAGPGADAVPTTPRWNTGKGAPPPAGVICQVCQTENEPDREFCKKCASPMRAAEVVKPRLITRGFVGRFLLSFLIGVAVPVGGAAAYGAVANQPKELPGTPVSLTLQGGEPLDFEVVETADGEAGPIAPLPPTSTVQLAVAKQIIDTTPPGENIDAKWWDDGVPRVRAVSQFDGGPLQKVNCSMAAGAMLARLAFGIVTSGSQLRSLQADQDGGTSFGNVNEALQKGWRVSFLRGSLTALQLRALSFAGAGVTVSLDYGEVPVGTRIQKSFTGNHAVYIDAFSPDALNGAPAYWVIDPIGHSWSGYKGGWWSADAVERAALARNGGWIAAAWAFAGGRIPEPRPRLPTSAYPGAQPGSSPGASPGQPTIGPPIEDPMPVVPPPVIGDPETGTPPPETPVLPPIDFTQDVFELDPGTSFAKCATIPTPKFCPIGIIGIIDIGGGPIPTKPPLRDINLLYADVLWPGSYQIIFETPPDTDGSLFLWTGTSGELREAQVSDGFVDGKDVKIATINLDPNIGFSFFTTATGDNYRAISDVGSMTIRQ